MTPAGGVLVLHPVEQEHSVPDNPTIGGMIIGAPLYPPGNGEMDGAVSDRGRCSGMLQSVIRQFAGSIGAVKERRIRCNLHVCPATGAERSPPLSQRSAAQQSLLIHRVQLTLTELRQRPHLLVKRQPLISPLCQLEERLKERLQRHP